MRATPALVLAHKCAIRTTFGPRAVCLHTSFVCRLQATSNPNQAAAAVCSRTSVLVASNLTWCCTPFKGWVPASPCACTQVCAPRFFATPERRLGGPKSVSPTLGRPPIAARWLRHRPAALCLHTAFEGWVATFEGPEGATAPRALATVGACTPGRPDGGRGLGYTSVTE